MKCLLLGLLQSIEKSTTRNTVTTGASAALMTSTGDHQVGDERCIDTLLAVGSELQAYRYTGRNRDNKWSLKSKLYFYCSEGDAAGNTGMRLRPLGSAR